MACPYWSIAGHEDAMQPDDDKPGDDPQEAPESDPSGRPSWPKIPAPGRTTSATPGKS